MFESSKKKIGRTTCYPLEAFAKKIHQISQRYFDFLLKKIIETYYWEDKNEIQFQNLILDETFGHARFEMLRTFSLILQNDIPNSCFLLNEVNEAAWHAIILWFFDKK